MKLTFSRIVRSELTKLRTLRSTWIVLSIAGVLTAAIAGVISWTAQRDGAASVTLTEAVGRAYLGVDLFSLVIGVLGVLLMTGEYGSGLIRATLAAVPRRLPVLWAKALVLLIVTLPLMVVICTAAFEVSQLFASTKTSLTDSQVLQATLGAAAAPAAMALLGLGFGAILRHTAAAITAFVAVLLVIPALLPAMLPASARDDLLPYSPVAAAQAMYAIDPGGNPFRMLSPGAGALVTVGWVILAIAGGAVVLQRRDA